jgi:hypothetical protein
MIENATVEDLQHELQVMVEESIADLFGEEDDAPDEGSIAADLFSSMTWLHDYPADKLAEVARREFGFCPGGARPDVSKAFGDVLEEW